MITITRRFRFEAGHRVFQHESKCAHPHGHSYLMEVTAYAEELDPLGRIIDFSVIKKALGDWIDTNWDHGMIYFEKDETMKSFCEQQNFKSYCLGVNPTAENMANYFLREICPQLLPDSIMIIEVKLWETANCFATAGLG